MLVQVKEKAVAEVKEKAVFDTDEAANYIGVAKQTLNDWRCSGAYDLPYLRVGRLVKYRRADLDAWLQSRLVSNSNEANS